MTTYTDEKYRAIISEFGSFPYILPPAAMVNYLPILSEFMFNSCRYLRATLQESKSGRIGSNDRNVKCQFDGKETDQIPRRHQL